MDGLGLHHEYLLCAIRDVPGTWSVRGYEEQFGFAASLVAEMQMRDRLVPVAANTFALRSGPLSTDALGAAEARLVDRQLSMKKCISAVNFHWFSGIGQIRRAALEELVRAGILRREPDTFLFVTWRMRYPTVDRAVENRIRARLRDHLARVDDGDPPERDDLLLSLLRVSKLLGNIWDETTLQALRPAIEERTKRAPIGKLVKGLVDEAHAAAAAAGAAYACPAAFRSDLTTRQAVR